MSYIKEKLVKYIILNITLYFIIESYRKWNIEMK